ncbi:MAG: hypothetical protein JOY71_30215 [Acetobacteraceae bacterium]|nr:hypothetical protein [Acetobacteraceae bacterium]
MPVLFLAWTRLRRLAARFEALVADFRAGRVRATPALSREAGDLLQMPGLPSWPQPYRLPRGFGWLLRMVPESAAYAGQVEQLLADPEMAALLAESAEAGCILRPLCRMLGIRTELGPFGQRREPQASPADGVGLDDAAAGDPGPLGALFGPGPEPEPRAESPPELGLLVQTSDNAGADPPPAVSWRRAEPG